MAFRCHRRAWLDVGKLTARHGETDSGRTGEFTMKDADGGMTGLVAKVRRIDYIRCGYIMTA